MRFAPLLTLLVLIVPSCRCLRGPLGVAKSRAYDFVETPAGDAVFFLGQLTGDSTVLHSSAWGETLTFQRNRATSGDVLRAVSDQTSLICTRSCGAIYVGPPETLKRIRKVAPLVGRVVGTLEWKLDKKLSFCWPDDPPLSGIAQFVANLTGIEIVLQVPEDTLLREHMVVIDSMRCRDALRWLAALSGTNLDVHGETIAFVPMRNSRGSP